MTNTERSNLNAFLKTLDWTRLYVDLYDSVEEWMLMNTEIPAEEIFEKAESLVSARLR